MDGKFVRVMGEAYLSLRYSKSCHGLMIEESGMIVNALWVHSDYLYRRSSSDCMIRNSVMAYECHIKSLRLSPPTNLEA